MKIDIFGQVRDALKENGIKIKAIEQENNCVHFDLDFSEHDRAKDDEIKQCKSDFCKFEKQLEEIKGLLKENGVVIVDFGKAGYSVVFSEHDKQFNDKIDEIIEINSGLCCQIRKLENDIETLKNTIRLFAREEVHHD